MRILRHLKLSVTCTLITAANPKKLIMAATGIDKSWQPKTERISQRYTTDWKELVVVK